ASLKKITREATKEIEKKAILQALYLNHWNKRKAARILRISYKALFNKMHALGISLHPPG
ncbi:MAG: helix-turn-helix domain-containing protein, partial [Pseudomonadota bacterium]